MDSIILYEKDGMIFTKIVDKKYKLDFSMENKNILISNIIDFSLFKLIYELNNDIYESVNLTKISENEAVVVFVMKHLFEDLGLPQKYFYLHIIGILVYIIDNNRAINNIYRHIYYIYFKKLA